MIRVKLILTGLVALLAFGLVMTCQQTPLDPMQSDQTEELGQYKAVPVSPEFMGLAKSLGNDVEEITREDGGTVGGLNTHINTVVFPPYALVQDCRIHLSVELVDDPEDPMYGGVIFSVSAFTNENSAVKEKVSIEPGKTAKIYANKKYFTAKPSGVLNMESGEINTDVVDCGTHWMIEVAHFSSWGWIY